MLWLALHLPSLPIDIATRSDPTASVQPLAIFTQRGNRQRVAFASHGAQALGVRAGMPLAAALSLAAGLRTQLYNPAAEQAALAQLASWAQQFTPTVSLQPPAGLLLEIGGCLSLFGSLEKLLAQVIDGIRALGFQAQPGCAPTPLGAWWLARADRPQPVTAPGMLEAALAALPLALLDLAGETRQRLSGLGLATLGDCLQLPRAGFARRLGPDLVMQLDRALGIAPDPRRSFDPPQRFDSRIQLPAPVDNTEPLLFLLRRLLLELAGFLRGRGSGAMELHLHCLHAGRPPTPLTLALLSPNREVEHLLALWREKLDRHSLTAPVEGIRLVVERLAPLAELTRDLLQTETHGGVDFTQFLERLRNRLGPAALRTLASSADHRPELAWRYVDDGKPEHIAEPGKLRPLWLMETPQPLETRGDHPQLHGPLMLLQGPERIESGWWDGGDVRRDYYLAENPWRQRLWVFQAFTHPPRWYLHGLFG